MDPLLGNPLSLLYIFLKIYIHGLPFYSLPLTLCSLLTLKIINIQNLYYMYMVLLF